MVCNIACLSEPKHLRRPLLANGLFMGRLSPEEIRACIELMKKPIGGEISTSPKRRRQQGRLDGLHADDAKSGQPA